MTPTQEIISRATINGNVLKLPEGQLDRKVYMDVAKSIEIIGGKWKGGKVAGFVFAEDPTEKVAILLSGEKIVSAKKEFQYFPTQPLVALSLVRWAEIEPNNRILEPEAGQGAIVDVILSQTMGMGITIGCFELMPENYTILERKYKRGTEFGKVQMLGHDFLTEPNPTSQWDRIIANPPFANNQDIDHVRKMFYHLVPGGILTAIMSPHWTFANERKCVEFREWMKANDAEVEEIEAGAFKESGTNIKTVMVKIRKPTT